MSKKQQNAQQKKKRREARKAKAAKVKNPEPSFTKWIEQQKSSSRGFDMGQGMRFVSSSQSPMPAPRPTITREGLFDLRFKALPVWDHPDYQEKLLVWEGELGKVSNIFEKVSVFLARDAIPCALEKVEKNIEMQALGETFANTAIFHSYDTEMEEFQEMQQKPAYGAFNAFFMSALDAARSVKHRERIMWSRVEMTAKNGDVLYYDPEGEYWEKNLVRLFNEDFIVLRHKVAMSNY